MPEVILGLHALLAVIFTAVAMFFLMCGGRSNEELKLVHMDLWGWSKANRFWGRFFAPALFGFGILVIAVLKETLEWPVFAFIAHYSLVPRLPHRIPILRLQKAILWCGSGFWLCLISGLWWLLAVQMISGIAAQLIWGTKNPTPAPVEEFGIYFAMSWLLALML
jgi:hypothetical protein